MLHIYFEKEEDGRWIAEIEALPGVLAYGKTRSEARHRANVLAARTVADRIENGEEVPKQADHCALQKAPV